MENNILEIDVEKYYNEQGELGILISHGYGAGWSTCNDGRIAYDKRVVEKWLEKVSEYEMTSFLNNLGYKDTYMGGYKNLRLEFIPRGTMFCIHEYDGHESIETLETMDMMMA